MTATIQFIDYEPREADFAAEVKHGLSQSPKTLPCKFFYDEEGSHLFDDICELEEYYPTRTEVSILRTHARSMAECVGKGCAVIEFGSGSSTKTPILLNALDTPALYVPIEISREHLRQSSERINEAFPDLEVVALCADYIDDLQLPPELDDVDHRLLFFPGSTIGNFTHEEAVAFMSRMKRIARSDGAILMGADLYKDEDIMIAAYNDRKGVTASFNMNILRRINQELGGDFDLDAFHHEGRLNREKMRIEMHLVCDADQTVHIQEQSFSFTKSETIFTESSHKFTCETFSALANEAGLQVDDIWVDENEWFSVQLLRPMN